jgi:hypothetical protein
MAFHLSIIVQCKSTPLDFHEALKFLKKDIPIRVFDPWEELLSNSKKEALSTISSFVWEGLTWYLQLWKMKRHCVVWCWAPCCQVQLFSFQPSSFALGHKVLIPWRGFWLTDRCFLVARSIHSFRWSLGGIGNMQNLITFSNGWECGCCSWRLSWLHQIWMFFAYKGVWFFGDIPLTAVYYYAHWSWCKLRFRIDPLALNCCRPMIQHSIMDTDFFITFFSSCTLNILIQGYFYIYYERIEMG